MFEVLWRKLKWWFKITPALIFGDRTVHEDSDSWDCSVKITAIRYRGKVYITNVNCGDSKDG